MLSLSQIYGCCLNKESVLVKLSFSFGFITSAKDVVLLCVHKIMKNSPAVFTELSGGVSYGRRKNLLRFGIDPLNIM